MTMKRKLLLAAISGVLCALAMPRPGIWLFSWFALVPLFAALRGARPAAAALCGLVTGTLYFAVVLYWIWLFGYLPWTLLAIVQGAFVAVFAAAAARTLPSRIGSWGYAAVPAIWTAVQWARGLGPYGFTWGSFAHAQANNLMVSQIAAVTGPWGVDFLVCLTNLALAEMLAPAARVRSIRFAAAAALAVAAALAAGWLEIRAAPAPEGGAKVAIIQGNLSHDVQPPVDYVRDALDVYTSMTLDAARGKPDIIVWPETTLTAELAEPGLGTIVGMVANRAGAYLLVGALDAPDDPSITSCHNAAHLFDPSGRKVGVYRKVQLVPFGEFVPLRNTLPFLDRYQIRDEDVVPGSAHNLLPTRIGEIGVSICFESIFPHISRRETLDGAVALFVLTNDSWFGRTQAARQHLMMSRLRAIENRRYVARAASTGISSVIDPWGRQLGEIGIFRRGILTGRVLPRRDLTIYTRFGDWFAWGCAAFSVVSLLWSAGARNVLTQRTSGSAPDIFLV